MTIKAIMNALERVFAAEIEKRLPLVSDASIFKHLADDGLVETMDRKFGEGTLAVTVRGWQLTHAGRFLYCSFCDDQEAATTETPVLKDGSC